MIKKVNIKLALGILALVVVTIGISTIASYKLFTMSNKALPASQPLIIPNPTSTQAPALPPQPNIVAPQHLPPSQPQPKPQPLSPTPPTIPPEHNTRQPLPSQVHGMQNLQQQQQPPQPTSILPPTQPP